MSEMFALSIAPFVGVPSATERPPFSLSCMEASIVLTSPKSVDATGTTSLYQAVLPVVANVMRPQFTTSFVLNTTSRGRPVVQEGWLTPPNWITFGSVGSGVTVCFPMVRPGAGGASPRVSQVDGKGIGVPVCPG